MKLSNGKILKQLVLICVSIFIVYTVCIILLFFRSDISIKADEFDKNNQLLTKNASLLFDQKIGYILSLCEQLSLDSDVIRFANNQNPAEKGYQTLLAVNKVSSSSNSFSSLSCSVFVINPYLDMVATPLQSMNIDGLAQILGIDRACITDTFANMQQSTKIREVQFYSQTLGTNEKDNLLLFVDKKSGSQTIPIAVLVSRTYLFDGISLQSDSAMECLIDHNPVLVETNALATSSKGDYRQNAKKYTDTSDTFANITFALYSKGYQYVENNLRFFILILTLNAFLFAAVLLLLLAAIHHIYRPIGSIVSNIKKYAGYDSDDEIYILEHNFTNLTEHNKALEEQAKQGTERLKEHVIAELLYGVLRADKIEAERKNGCLAYLKDDITVTVIAFSDTEHLKNVDSAMRLSEIKDTIFRYLKENIKLDNGAEMIFLNEKHMVILTSGYQPDTLQGLIMQELGLAEEYYGIVLKIATGSCCNTLSDVKDSYFEAVSMLERQNDKSGNMLNAANYSMDCCFFYPLDIEQNLIASVQQGNAEKTALLLDSILQKNAAHLIGPAQLEEFKLAITMTLKRLLQLATQKEIADANIRIPDTAPENNAFQQEIKAAFLNLCNAYSEKELVFSNTLTRQIIAYIKDHYMNDISLTDIAERYNISIGYIGKLFRENTNTSFKSYLNQYRISIAKQLIANDKDIKLLTVAERVGFTNAITFNRVFKRYENLSPSEYRDSLD